jgi:DNA modification methylase
MALTMVASLPASPAIPTHSLTVADRIVSELKPYAGNSRSHPDRQVDALADGYRQFGMINPILVDESGVIIAGHGRWLAARRAGLESVPTIELAGLTDMQKRKLRLSDNKIAALGGTHLDLHRIELGAIFQEALDLNIKVEIPGFSAGEIDVALTPKKNIDPADDQAPPPSAEPRTQPGDIIVLGPHRIACGDVRDQALMQRLMAGAVADAAFLDNPYNVEIGGHANVRTKHREFAMASGEMTPSEFEAFLYSAFDACAAVSRDGAVHFLTIDWRHIDELKAAADRIYGSLLNLCVWRKGNAGMGSLYRSQHELVFVYRVGQSAHFNAVELGRHGRNRTNCWDYPSVNTGGARADELNWHPTVKPVALVADAIQDVTKRGEVVLDAFLGSGTSLIAAERTGRVFRGLDIDPAYVDIAIERWVSMTGGAPKLERLNGWNLAATTETTDA